MSLVGIPSETYFLQTRSFLLFRTIVSLFFFVGIVPVARTLLKVRLSSKILNAISQTPLIDVVELHFAEL